jgi:hypothetical protein
MSLTAYDLVAHLERQREFSLRTFGPGRRVEMVTDHIGKELNEVRSSNGDLAEWIDVILLALDGALRTGATSAQVAAALEAKQSKNERRAWPDWRTAPAGKAIEHDRSAEGKKPRAYISGPMTGMPDFNFPAFNREAARLRSIGYDVVNPVELNPDSTTAWHDCMRRDLAALLECDVLALLDGWQRSAGAHLEMHVAHRVGIEIAIASELSACGDGYPRRAA